MTPEQIDDYKTKLRLLSRHAIASEKEFGMEIFRRREVYILWDSIKAMKEQG